MKRFAVTILVAMFFFVMPQSAALAHDWYVDDTCGPNYDPYFYASGRLTDWYAPSNSSAINGCYMYTMPQTGNSREAAIWYLPVDSNYNHSYRVQAHIPSSWGCTGTSVRYERWAFGTSGGVTSNHFINQGAVASPMWMNVFTLGLRATSGGYVKMVDLTGSATQRVCADQLRYITQ